MRKFSVGSILSTGPSITDQPKFRTNKKPWLISTVWSEPDENDLPFFDLTTPLLDKVGPGGFLLVLGVLVVLGQNGVGWPPVKDLPNPGLNRGSDR